MGISLCSFVKDEANCIMGMLSSVEQYVDEIVIVDTGSTDYTQDICRKFGARVYEVGFTDFGKIRTLTAHLATEQWVLMLDADEELHNPSGLMDATHNRYKRSDAYAFPRKRWLDLERTKQTEIEAYPDWQVRLFRNNKNYTWKRELHEYFDGTAVEHISIGPTIDHFHDPYKSPEALQKRSELYTRLAAQAGVTIEGGHKL